MSQLATRDGTHDVDFLLYVSYQRVVYWYDRDRSVCNYCVYFSVPTAREQLKKLSVLPMQVLKEYPSLSHWSVLQY